MWNLIMGMVVGFFVAAPLGPIDLLCIHRSLLWGMRTGFVTGLGAAFADVIYGAAASFGIFALESLLISYRFQFHFLGGAFLFILGCLALRDEPVIEPQGAENKGLVTAFLSTFFLALLSPSTILSFIAAFAILGVGVEMEDGSSYNPLLLTIGIFLGSTSWWLILSSSVTYFKYHFKLRHLHWLARFSGALMMIAGVLIIILPFFCRPLLAFVLY